MKKIFLLKVLSSVMICLMLAPQANAQDDTVKKPRKTSLNGYLKFLQTVQFEKVSGNWSTDNIFHNRMNFKWYLAPSLTFSAEARTRLFYGETVKVFPQYPDIVKQDGGYFNLSTIISKGDSYFLHSVLDRVNLSWTSGKWLVRGGRQRINWGQSFVWNPNDIFNAYSFFDFDYEERPGSDAVLIRYYIGPTSSIEFATAFAGDIDNYKIAAMYRLNKGNYDFQVLTGKVGTDYAIGGGWSGQIKTAGFKGEITWLEPFDDFLSGNGTVVGTLSVDYTFPRSLFVHSEVIYNSYANPNPSADSPINFLMVSRSPKTLTVTKWSWFNEASYQITPLIKAGLYSIYYPNEKAVFLGPNAEFSITENIYLLYAGQFFVGPDTSIYGRLGYFNYFRVKWSF